MKLLRATPAATPPRARDATSTAVEWCQLDYAACVKVGCSAGDHPLTIIAAAARGLPQVVIATDADLVGVRIPNRLATPLPADTQTTILDAGFVPQRPGGRPFSVESRDALAHAAASHTPAAKLARRAWPAATASSRKP